MDRIAILALDIATQMGVAFGEPGGEPYHTSIRLGGAGLDRGQRGACLKRWLVPFVREHRPTHIFVEQPVRMQGNDKNKNKTNADALEILSFLAWSAMEGGEMLGISKANRVFAHVQSVRKYFLGQGRPADKKAAVISRCRELGWNPKDDNAADALALWAFGCARIAPEASLAHGHSAPLFTPRKVAEPDEDEIPDIEF